MEKILDRTVFSGILNPKGEPDGKQTTYFTESQLKNLEKYINDKRRKKLPLHILHYTHDEDGNPIEASGEIYQAQIKPNGKLYIAGMLYDNDNGKVAHELLNHKEVPMRGLSLGSELGLNDDLEILFKKPVEVSLCYLGARKGTNITSVTKVKNVLKLQKINNKDKDNLFLKNNTQENKQKNLNQKDNNTNSLNKEKKMESMFDKNHEFSYYVSNKGPADYPKNVPTYREVIDRVLSDADSYGEKVRYQNVNVNANYDDSPDQYQQQQQNRNYQDVATTTESAKARSADEIISSLVSDYQKKGENNKDHELEEYLKKIKNPEAEERITYDLQITEPSLSTKFEKEMIDFRNSRPPIDENLPEHYKKEIREARERQEAELQKRHVEALKKDSDLRNNLQTKFKTFLPTLIKAAEQRGQPLSQKDIEAVATLFTKSAELGPEFAEGTCNLINAQAALNATMKEQGKVTANILEDTYHKFASAKEAVLKQQQTISQMQEELEKYRRENDALKNNTPSRVRATVQSTPQNQQQYQQEGYRRDGFFKKVKTNAMSDDQPVSFYKRGNQFDNDWGKVGYGTSVKLYPNESEDFHQKQGKMMDTLMNNCPEGFYNAMPYYRGLMENPKLKY